MTVLYYELADGTITKDWTVAKASGQNFTTNYEPIPDFYCKPEQRGMYTREAIAKRKQNQ